MEENDSNKSLITLDGNTGLERTFLKLESGLILLVGVLGYIYLHEKQSPYATALLKVCATLALLAGVCAILRKAFHEVLEINLKTGKIDVIQAWFGNHPVRKPYCNIQDVEALVFMQTLKAPTRYGREDAPFMEYELFLRTRDQKLVSASPTVRLNKLHLIFNTAQTLSLDFGWEIVHPQNEIGTPMQSLEAIYENQKFKAEQGRIMTEQNKVLGDFFMPILIVCILISIIFTLAGK
ncbi:MAG: hypothetical protein H3C47_13460 [Candidatus Cloacimonetes bacterium]|nr:hypothetical protein [Candidatus Cloacimonadota bacterium]